jgi:hypothetical protein
LYYQRTLECDLLHLLSGWILHFHTGSTILLVCRCRWARHQHWQFQNSFLPWWRGTSAVRHISRHKITKKALCIASRIVSWPRNEKDKFETPPLTPQSGIFCLMIRVASMKLIAYSLCSSKPFN